MLTQGDIVNVRIDGSHTGAQHPAIYMGDNIFKVAFNGRQASDVSKKQLYDWTPAPRAMRLPYSLLVPYLRTSSKPVLVEGDDTQWRPLPSMMPQRWNPISTLPEWVALAGGDTVYVDLMHLDGSETIGNAMRALPQRGMHGAVVVVPELHIMASHWRLHNAA